MDRSTYVFRSNEGDFPAVGVRGASAHSYVQQIFDVLENQLSRQYRQLFAEPVVDEGSKRIDWWSDLDGPVEPFSDLSEDQKSAFRLEIEDRFGAIQDRAAALRRSGQDDAIFIAELLSAVVKTPSEANWFSVGGRPVLTLWAHGRSTYAATSDPTVLKAAAPAVTESAVSEAPAAQQQDPVVKPALQPEPAERGFWAPIWAWLLAIPAWLRWLLFILLLLVFLSWLLRFCAPNFDPFSLNAPELPNLGADSGAHPDTSRTDQAAGDTGSATEPPQVPSNDGSALVRPPLVGQPDVVQVPGVIGDTGSGSSSGGGKVPVTPPQAQIILQYEEARASEAQLRAKIVQLEVQIAARQQQCTPAVCGLDGSPLPIAPQSVGPKPGNSSEAEPKATPELAPASPSMSPEPEQPAKPQSEVQSAPPTEETAQTEPEPVPEAKPEPQPVNCPVPRPAWETPEIVVVFDTSGSMANPSNMSAGQRDGLIRRAQNGDASALRELNRLSNSTGPKLMDEAKDAIGNMVKKMPKDVDIGYIEFGQCDRVLNHSFYSNDQRGQLLDKIGAATPQKGTPLARAIERAGNIIQGEFPNEKGTIVVVTDGYDSCGGDPCAAARAIAQSKPGVTINVVNLGLEQRVQCISQNGQGRIITADDASLRDAIIEASEEPPISENCR